MILRTSAASPFGRKVRIAIDVLGLAPQIRVVVADTNDPADTLRKQNPLGKVPTLVLDNGEALFDSRVIIEYLNSLDGRDLLIPADGTRIGSLRQQSLADGLLDAALLQVYEKRYRPDTHQVASWVALQQSKVDRALDFAEHDLPTSRAAKPHIGEIALAAALGYLDFRFDGRWRTTHPALAQWLSQFAARCSAYEATSPKLPI
ncbi:glutathione S-transferase family protein [Variovorax rhizosphaerae]|uniref:Glutathione S-transferase family protein n=1 Tax=Variovorax rhizosphaerae TaxID=1836200 RepID=A0ABU8WYJ2_9BURK